MDTDRKKKNTQTKQGLGKRDMRKQAESKATKWKKTAQQRWSAENKVQQHLEAHHIAILRKVVPIAVSLKDQGGKVDRKSVV